jgi:hypothetical protein
MQSILKSWVAGCLLASSAFAQDVTLDLVTLKMPAELAAQLQRRIEEGGPGASAAVDKLPELAKSKKLEELGRWHVVVANGDKAEHTIAGGRELKMTTGEIVSTGIEIETEPSLMEDGTIIVRAAISGNTPIKGDRSNYSFRQINTMAALKPNEWLVLGSWQEEGECTVFLSKFSTATASGSFEGQRQVRQASLAYTLWELNGGPTTPMSGEPARELLKKGKALEGGFLVIDQSNHSVVNGGIESLEPSVTGEAHFEMSQCFMFAGDTKTAEAGILMEYTPKRGTVVSFSDWVELPVGTVTLVPVGKDLVLALELRAKVIVSNEPKGAEKGYPVPPSARRLLAQAAGLPVPKPVADKLDYRTLPKIDQSLAKLGLDLPAGCHVIEDSERSEIRLIGPNSPHDKLREILAKHLTSTAR